MMKIRPQHSFEHFCWLLVVNYPENDMVFGIFNHLVTTFRTVKLPEHTSTVDWVTTDLFQRK